jgi:7-cyano-7-deazaguanine synthase in queuosine biosynthesis
MSDPQTASPLVVVALSGGMDSATLLARYADRGHPLLAVSVN